jgi:hypothetical protein
MYSNVSSQSWRCLGSWQCECPLVTFPGLSPYFLCSQRHRHLRCLLEKDKTEINVYLKKHVNNITGYMLLWIIQPKFSFCCSDVSTIFAITSYKVDYTDFLALSWTMQQEQRLKICLYEWAAILCFAYPLWEGDTTKSCCSFDLSLRIKHGVKQNPICSLEAGTEC